MTHWKRMTNPDYLGAYAFDPGEEKIGTIEFVQQEVVLGPDGKKEDCTVAHFREPGLKPLILNATNCKAITRLYKTPYIEEWVGKSVVMRVQQVKAFGEIVDAVRIKPEIPTGKSRDQPVLCADCKKPIVPASGMSPNKLAEYTKNKYGRALCAACAKKAAETMKTKKAEEN